MDMMHATFHKISAVLRMHKDELMLWIDDDGEVG